MTLRELCRSGRHTSSHSRLRSRKGAFTDFASLFRTASAEVKWMNGWSATGTFEGEFSNVTRSYAGKGVARYSW
jgi:hypothetical protein